MNQIVSIPSPTTAALHSVADVRAPLNFIRPQDTKPVFQSSALTGGPPRILFETEDHTVSIGNLRDIADTLSVDREGFALLRHETAVRSISALYFFAALFLVLISVPLILQAPHRASLRVAGLVYMLLGGGVVVVGVGIRGLQRWVRVPVGVLSGLGLLAVPIGTLLNGYALYLVFGRKGRVVFSPDYQEIVERTPHLRQRTSPLVIALGLLILGLIGFWVLRALYSG